MWCALRYGDILCPVEWLAVDRALVFQSDLDCLFASDVYIIRSRQSFTWHCASQLVVAYSPYGLPLAIDFGVDLFRRFDDVPIAFRSGLDVWQIVCGVYDPHVVAYSSQHVF